MTESDLPPECLDDDPPQHCYTIESDGEASSITHLPETGVDVYAIFMIAILLMWLGVVIYAIITWRPQ